MKTINLNNIIQFQIPENWISEQDEDFSLFYEDTPDSATLRVQTLLFSVQNTKQIIQQKLAESSTIALENGLPCAFKREQSEENGEILEIDFWDITIPISDTQIAICCFSYTILAEQASQEHFIHERELINHAICHADFFQSNKNYLN